MKCLLIWSTTSFMDIFNLGGFCHFSSFSVLLFFLTDWICSFQHSNSNAKCFFVLFCLYIFIVSIFSVSSVFCCCLLSMIVWTFLTFYVFGVFYLTSAPVVSTHSTCLALVLFFDVYCMLTSMFTVWVCFWWDPKPARPLLETPTIASLTEFPMLLSVDSSQSP